MPQLDILTFYSQAITLLFVFVALFVFSITFFLPEVYKAKKVRWFIQSRLNETLLPPFLVNLYEFRLSAIVSSCDLLVEKIAQFESETISLVSETADADFVQDDDDQFMIDAVQDLQIAELFVLQDVDFLFDDDDE